MSGLYHFKPVTKNDSQLLKAWLSSPEVAKWWGDPDYELGLITEDLDNPLIDLWLVSLDQAPFAYIQDYCVHDWPQAHFEDLPARARAIDTFIGVPDMFGKGHGRGYLNQHASGLLDAGAEDVVIDPYANNERAIRAYEAAGFARLGEHQTSEGPVLLMKFVKPS